MNNKILNRLIQTILVLGILVLVVFIFRSIMRPEKFRTMAEERREVVVEKLKDIRTAQIGYKNVKGSYAQNFDLLIDFLENGKMPIVAKIGVVPDTLTEAQALKAGIIKRDTVLVDAFKEIFKDKPNLNVKKLSFIPYSNNEKFIMDADTIERGGIKVPVFIAIAPKMSYLGGIEEDPKLKGFINSILYTGIEKQFIKQEKYKDMIVGSLDDPSTNGNWE
jgi:hypothetical protein